MTSHISQLISHISYLISHNFSRAFQGLPSASSPTARFRVSGFQGFRHCQPSSSAVGRLRRPKAEAFFDHRSLALSDVALAKSVAKVDCLLSLLLINQKLNSLKKFLDFWDQFCNMLFFKVKEVAIITFLSKVKKVSI